MKGRSLAPDKGPFAEHEQALKAAAAAAEEVERFAAALPPLPVWDTLPVPVDALDELDAELGSAQAAAGAAADDGGTAEIAAAPSSNAEASPHTGADAAVPDVLPAAVPSVAVDADAIAIDAAAIADEPANSALQAAPAQQPAATDAADAEALALAELAADASTRDRRRVVKEEMATLCITVIY